MGLIQQVQEAIFKVFGPMFPDEDRLRNSLSKCVCRPEEDPGEWAPNSFAVIHGESIGLPGPTVALEQWLEVSEYLDGYYVENINEAVAAVYKV